jgi:hypothetical protein
MKSWMFIVLFAFSLGNAFGDDEIEILSPPLKDNQEGTVGTVEQSSQVLAIKLRLDGKRATKAFVRLGNAVPKFSDTGDYLPDRLEWDLTLREGQNDFYIEVGVVDPNNLRDFRIIKKGICIYFLDFDKGAFEAASTRDTVASYREYLEKRPQGRYRDQAEAALKRLDEEAYKEAIRDDTRNAFSAYLRDFPDGAFTKEIRSLLEERNAENDDLAAFRKYADPKNKEAILEFIKRYPDNKYVEEAKDLLLPFVIEEEKTMLLEQLIGEKWDPKLLRTPIYSVYEEKDTISLLDALFPFWKSGGFDSLKQSSDKKTGLLEIEIKTGGRALLVWFKPVGGRLLIRKFTFHSRTIGGGGAETEFFKVYHSLSAIVTAKAREKLKTGR